MRPVLLLLLLAASALFASGPAESSIRDFTLPNGMRWIICPTAHQGDAALLLYIDAGGAQETPGRTGLVSALAAMWRLDAPALERQGARRPQVLSNPDRIIFRSTWPATNIEPWFRAHAALLQSPSLSGFPAGLAAAMGMRDKIRQGGGALLDDFLAAAFTVHPYRHPAHGFPGEIDQLQPADAAAFLSRYFVPANAIAVAAGDVQPDRIRALAGQYFAPLPKLPAPEPLRSVEPPQTLERRLIEHAPSQPALLVAFPAPAIASPGAAIDGVLRSLLARRLKARLMEKEKLAARVDALPYPAMKYPFLTMILCFMNPGIASAQVENAIHEELARLAAEPVTPDEIAPFTRSDPAEFARYAPFELATELADWHAMSGTWRNMYRHSEARSQVTPAQVQALAGTLFVPAKRTTAISVTHPK